MSSDTKHRIDAPLQVHVPYEHVVGVLSADPAAIVSPAVSEVRLAIGAVSHGLTVEIDWLIEGSERCRLPMRWYAAGRPMLSPAMTAELVVIRTGWAEAELRFVGQYRPLFDGLGAEDREAFRSLAERMAQTFLDALARHVSERVGLHKQGRLSFELNAQPRAPSGMGRAPRTARRLSAFTCAFATRPEDVEIHPGTA